MINKVESFSYLTMKKVTVKGNNTNNKLLLMIMLIKINVSIKQANIANPKVFLELTLLIEKVV